MLKKMLSGLLMAGFCFTGSSALAKEEVIINGSTTVLPIIQKASETFMQNNPSISLSISGGGSGNGIKALVEGLCDIAMSSRDIKSSEVEDAKKKGVMPNRVAVAFDAIVPVVHPANPVQNLTLEQLQKIYMGEITNWKELGGNDENIVVFSRETSSGTYESWADLVMKKNKVTPKASLQASNGAIVTSVSKNKKSIGYIGFGYMNQSVKAVSVDGQTASAKAVIEKQWPISRELFLFTNGEPKGAVKTFMDFMLDAEKGQKIVAETGFIPL